MGVVGRWLHRKGAELHLRIGGTCCSRGGVSLHIQQAAGQWAGLGRGAEAGGALLRPWNGILQGAEQASERASRTNPGPHPRPASDRAAAAAARTAATLGDPGPAGAAGGGGAQALDVPQRGGQSEKGGRGGLGWGAAPLLMWRRVGGGCGTRMERVPRLERVVLVGGWSRNTLRSKPNLGRYGSRAQALSCPGTEDRYPRKRSPPPNNQRQGDSF